MGGPCMCEGKGIKSGTDNFELCHFMMDGVDFHSAEQAYQFLKMKRKSDRTKIAARAPKTNESGWDYGMVVWNMGQRGEMVKNFEAIKVDVMYRANKEKLEQNPAMAADLVASSGLITHRGSGKFWDEWNPVLLMRIREELSPSPDESLLASLRARMDEYRLSRGGPEAPEPECKNATEGEAQEKEGAEDAAAEPDGEK